MTSNRIYPIAFKPDHLDIIIMKEVEDRLIDRGRLAVIAECGVTQTLMYDGRILAILGFIELFEGVLEVFVVPSIYVYQCPVQFVRFMKRTLKSLMADRKPLHRIETKALAAPDIDKWMLALGFAMEGTHYHYSAHKDNFRTWARLVQ